jgi:hypothetical protein
MLMAIKLRDIVQKRLVLAGALILTGCACAQGQQWGDSLAHQTEPTQTEPAQTEPASPTPTPTSQTDDKSPAPSSTQTDDKTSAPSTQAQTATGQPKKEKRGSFIFAPIPILSPTLGSGLVLGLGYVFKMDMDDKLSPPSTVGLAGAFTGGGSRGLGLGGRLYFKENQYQTTFLLAKGRVAFDFYGIGRIPGRDPIIVPLRAGGTVFFGEFMRNVWKDVFVGPRFQYRSLYATLNGIRPPGGFEVPAIDLQSVSAALGVHVQRDKRDSTFYPTKGSLFDFSGNFFDQAFGSRREYQTYQVSYNGYRKIGKGQVLAYRGMGCSANGSVPFYDLCLYGYNSDLRGYTTGQFQNRRMFATQAEYRREFGGRLGAVAFGGVGGVERNWNDFRVDHLLPAGGVGLRFKLDKKNHINYRIDFAYGREGHTLSIGVGEAF